MSEDVGRRGFMRMGAAGVSLLLGGSAGIPEVSASFHGEDWPLYGRDERNTAFSEKPGPTGNVSQAWRWDSGLSVRSAPVVDDGKMYVGDLDKKLYAVNAQDGQQRWEFEVLGEIRTAPAVYDGTVFVNTGGRTYAVSGGTEEWTHQDGVESDSSPTVSARTNTVYVSKSGSTFALNIDDGSVLWEFELSGPTVAGTTPALGDGSVYVADDEGSVYSIDEGSGSRQWETSVGSSVRGGLAVDGDTVYLADEDGVVRALSASDGSTVWTHDTTDSFESSPAVDGERVYVGGLRGGVHAVEAGSGDGVWEIDTGSPVNGSVAVAGDVVYYSEGTRVHAVTADSGDSVWTERAENNIYSPAVVGDTLYAGSDDDSVYAFRGDAATIGASIEILGASLNEESVGRSEAFSATVDLENRGSSRGEIDLEMTAGGDLVGSETVSVSGGGTETVTVTAEQGVISSGEYDVAVNGVSAGTVSVGLSDEGDGSDGGGDDEDVSDGDGNGDGGSDGGSGGDSNGDTGDGRTGGTGGSDGGSSGGGDTGGGGETDTGGDDGGSLLPTAAVVAGAAGVIGIAGGVVAAYLYSERENKQRQGEREG